MTRIIETLAEIAADYDALYCDLWGCLHNGVAPYPAAVAALRAFRARGGAVILMTNAPRPGPSVLRQLAAMGAPDDIADDVVSSGDAGRALLASGAFGAKVEHVGPERDLAFFEGLPVERVSRDAAESVVVTGLWDDETETPEDYAAPAAEWKARGLRMFCANPDIAVHRGDRYVYCAGAVADLYAKAGGEVTLSGKPHAPIYALAAERLAALRPGGAARVLMIGDGVATDVAGAAAAGIDALFVTGGLAAADVSDDPDRPDAARLEAFLADAGQAPAYAIGRLR